MKIVPATKRDLEFLVSLRNEKVSVDLSKRGELTREEIEQDYFYNHKKHVAF